MGDAVTGTNFQSGTETKIIGISKRQITLASAPTTSSPLPFTVQATLAPFPTLVNNDWTITVLNSELASTLLNGDMVSGPTGIIQTGTMIDWIDTDMTPNVVTIGLTRKLLSNTVNSPQTLTFTGSNLTFTLDTATLTPDGTMAMATYATNTLFELHHEITAEYNGDGNYPASPPSFPLFAQTVNATGMVTVTSSTTSAVFGQPVTFTATVVAVNPADGTPTGTVTFQEGSTTLASSITLDTNGQATFTTSTLAVGSNTITAVYSGDLNFAGVTGDDSASPVVVKASTSTSLSSSGGSGGGQQSILPVASHIVGGGSTTYTFTAVVTAVAPGAGTPTGSVTFYANGSVLGTSTLASGTAVWTSSTVVAGEVIRATYSGDSNFLSSTSKSLINADLGDTGIAYTPAQIRSAYGVNNLTLDGAGQTIAIVDAYDNPAIYQALDTFDAQFGVTASGPTLYDQYGPSSSFLSVVNESGQAAPLPATDPAGPGTVNWEVEESLDLEWAHALAPGRVLCSSRPTASRCRI